MVDSGSEGEVRRGWLGACAWEGEEGETRSSLPPFPAPCYLSGERINACPL